MESEGRGANRAQGLAAAQAAQAARVSMAGAAAAGVPAGRLIEGQAIERWGVVSYSSNFGVCPKVGTN